MDARRIEEIRRANFPAARRGYDRDAVDDFLDRLASSLESELTAPAEPEGAVKREIALLGERTAGIINAAEDAAAKAREEAEKRGVEAKEAAEELTRRARIEASEKSKKLVADAEKKAEQIIDEAVARRRRLNQAITSLAERRDEIAAETTRLASELSAAVGRLTEFDAPAEDSGAAGLDGDAQNTPHPPEAQAAVPDQPRPASGPARAGEPEPEAGEGIEEEEDGGEFAAESDVYEVLDDDELPAPGEVRLLVDPDEDEQDLIRPVGKRPVPGPEPTEENPLPLSDSDDEEFEPRTPSEDATAIHEPVPGDESGSKYRKR